MKYLFLALFIAASAVHLYHSWKDDSKKRAWTKPILLLALIGYYLTAMDSLSLLLLLALATSWLGDVLLIPKGNVWFTLGGISFLFSHFLFISVYIPQIDFGSVIWWIVIPVAIAYYAVAFRVIFAVRKNTPKPMLAPMYLYLLANSTMNAFALMQLTSLRSAGACVAYIGALLFFVSDCTLFLVRYHKKKDLIFKRHFTVMLTYLAGEFMIVQGMLMLL